MVDVVDTNTLGIKIARDKSTGVAVDAKGVQYSLEATAFNDTGIRDFEKMGDEAGWGYTPPRVITERNGLGSYAQAYPAILRDSDSRVVPIKDKTLAVDTTYKAKNLTTADGDTSDEVRQAETTAIGTPGIVATCLNHESQEQIFFPISETKIKVDHKTAPNLSTKIYDVTAGGTIDPTNIGTTKDFLFVESNVTCLRTEANFRESTTNKGPLNFETSGYPAITTPTTPANYEVKCVFDTGTGKWKWYAISEASALGVMYAKIAWNFTQSLGDLTRGELMNYDSTLNVFTASGTRIWVDWQKSAQCQFHTAGDNTIFAVRKVQDLVTKNLETYDMYYATQCVKDFGYHIDRFAIDTMQPDSNLDVILMTNDTATSVDPGRYDKIQTTIVGFSYDNKMQVTVPKTWNTSKKLESNYNYTEMNDSSKGLPFLASPIRPVFSGDFDKKLWSSAEKSNGNPIAIYQSTE